MTLLLKVKAGTPMTMKAGDNPTFEEWMGRIDKILTHYRGISIYDLPDCQFRNWYEGRLRPTRAINRALKLN